MSDEFITVGEVAKLLRLSWPTVKKRLRSGEIPGLTQHYGLDRVKRQVFEKWHEKQGS